MVINGFKSVIEYENFELKEKWFEMLLKMKGKKCRGKLLLLKKVIESKYGVPFWYKVKDIDPEISYYIQRQSESKFSLIL